MFPAQKELTHLTLLFLPKIPYFCLVVQLLFTNPLFLKMLTILNDKELYRKLCEEREDIPLFMQHWWMDTVCNYGEKTWQVILVEQDGQIVSALPYHTLVKFGIKLVIQPQLTQYNGIWIDYPANQTIRQRLSYEKMIMTKVIRHLNTLKFIFFQQNFHYSITNWHPFYWNRYKQTTQYTYIIKDIENPQKVFGNFHKIKQHHIKKAQRDLSVDFNCPATDFYNFQEETLRIKGDKITFCKELFLNIYEKAVKRNQGQIIAIKDNKNNIYSGTFFIWDKHSAYYLISAIHPYYGSSGASSLMIWEAIQFLNGKTLLFDFEGSMIEGVARSFEEFGAEQVPYFTIYKANPFLETLINLRQSLSMKRKK